MKSINVCRLTNIHSTHHHIVNVHRTLTTIVVRHHMRQAEIPVQFQWNDDTKKKRHSSRCFPTIALDSCWRVERYHWYIGWATRHMCRETLWQLIETTSCRSCSIRWVPRNGSFDNSMALEIYIYDKCRYARCARHRVQTKKKKIQTFFYISYTKKK